MLNALDRPRMTYEDLIALPDDGMRHELIDGEHYVSPSPVWAHQSILVNLLRVLATHVRAHGLGMIFGAPLDVILSRYDVVEPDVLFFTKDSFRRHMGEKWAEGPPDLAVEVLSPSTRRRDAGVKRRLYERVGVSEYWMVDPEREAVRVLRLIGGRYHESGLSLEDGGVLTSPLFPGLTLPLAEIFELPVLDAGGQMD